MTRSTLTQTFGRFSLSRKGFQTSSRSRGPRLNPRLAAESVPSILARRACGDGCLLARPDILTADNAVSYRQTVQRNDQSARGRAPLAQQSYCTSAIG